MKAFEEESTARIHPATSQTQTSADQELFYQWVESYIHTLHLHACTPSARQSTTPHLSLASAGFAPWLHSLFRTTPSMSLLLMYSRWHTLYVPGLEFLKIRSHVPEMSTVFLEEGAFEVMSRCPQDLEKRLLFGCESDGDAGDVESQVETVNVVSMSIPACLAWHVLSFLLGMATTVLVIGVVTGCQVGGGRFLLEP